MVGLRSTGLPECGPTESSAPEPCFLYNNKKIYVILFLICLYTDRPGEEGPARQDGTPIGHRAGPLRSDEAPAGSGFEHAGRAAAGLDWCVLH